MAEMDYLRQEFEFVKQNLEEATVALIAKLAVSKIDGTSLEALECEMAETSAYLEQLEQLRPTKKNNTIPYADAIQPMSKARATIAKTNALLRRADELAARENGTMQPPPSITARRNIPEVLITKFNGDVTMYTAFLAAFKLKYDSLPITDREKLQHLKENVTGNPLRAIRTLDLIDRNYAIALEALDKQYNRPDDVIDELFTRLTTMPQSSSATADLDATYHEVEGILAALTSHGQTLDSFAPIRKKVYERYPTWLVNTLCAKRLLPISEFQEGVRNIISTRASLQMNTSARAAYKSGGNRQKNKNAKPKDSSAPGASAKISNNNEKNTKDEKFVPPCIFCAAKHYSDQCTKFSTFAERIEIIKDRCKRCLRSDHETEKCPRRVFCFHCRKENIHHSSLCPDRATAPSASNSNATTSATDEKKVIAFARSHKGSHTTTMLTITNPVTKKATQVRALFDNGACETYIAEETARKLDLQLSKFKTIPISTFGDPVRMRTATTAFQISNNSDFTLNVVGETMPRLPQDVNLFSYDDFRRTFPQFAETSLLEQGRTHRIELLIGADYYFDILRPEKRVTVHEGLYLFATAFGNMLVGRTAVEQPVAMKTAYFAMSPTQAIEKLSALDVIGVRDAPLSVLQEEEIALSQFYENIKFINNRYQIRWPWREFPPPLQNNFTLALAVLKSQQRKLTDDTFAAYDAIIQQQIQSGIVEEFDTPDPYEKDVYYLPHHAVINLEKTTPIRIVFNGAAKQTGVKYAINEVIYKGINLLSNSVGIIIRTLLKAVLTVGDIEKAFHQLAIDPRDQNYVRFLWLRNRLKAASGSNLRFLRFLRVAFGIDASPFLLYATLRYHLQQIRTKQNEKLLDRLLQALYADNVSIGFDTEEEAIKFHKFAVEIFALCSMNIRSWASNGERVREQFTQPQKSSSISVLGILWDQYTDVYSLKEVHHQEGQSLRAVLSTVSSLYDPCGWVTPVITTAKLFLRELHDAKYDWDDPLSVPHAEKWKNVERTIIEASKLSLSRFHFSDVEDSAVYEIHTFSDASANAYAAVTYLRKVTNESTKVVLLLAKSRIVPRAPKLSIPKLELLAAVLASQHITFLRSELSATITATYLWIDSRCVLAWLTRNKILPVYIQRRVDSIRNVAEVKYRYVASERNPADLPSRGGDESTLSEFREGPAWLRKEVDWPEQSEYKADDFAITQTYEEDTKLVATTTRRTPPTPFSIDAGQYNSYLRLLRITMYAMRFISKFTLARDRQIFVNSSNYAAEKLWIQYEQLRNFYDVFDALQKRKSHDLIKKLNLYADSSNILRCAGRFQSAPLSVNEKQPVLLPQPRNSPFVKLLIEYYHRLTFHAGTTRTLHAIRRKFWIIAGRRAVYNIVRCCSHCKRFTARPYPQPMKSDLPELRLQESSPFSHVGVDTFGPIYLKQVKYYVIIVTDLVIRAVDLELLLTMTSEEISFALKRIFARRRSPEIIVSDNAPQFRQLQIEFSRDFTHDFRWNFLPSHSPWMGGAYERLIGLIKNCLSRTFYREQLSEPALRTALAEIAASLNSRPLTYVSAEAQDEPLTPNHFLRVPYSDISVEEVAVDNSQIRSFLRHAHEIRQKFWNAWRSHYLQYLRNQYIRYNFPKKMTTFAPRVGDIVVVHAKLQKRDKWPLGKVIKLNRSADNVVRSVNIQTKNGVIVRPLLEVYPLELHTNVAPPDDLPPADDWDSFEIEETVLEAP